MSNTADIRRGANSAGKYYVLDNDINLTKEWVPISDFYGTLNGRGYGVKNLYVLENSNRKNAGLFDSCLGATIKNISVHIGTQGVTASLSPNPSSGGIAGTIYRFTTINNCYVTGNVRATATDYYATYASAGGLVGYSFLGLISSSYTTGDVNATASSLSQYSLSYANAGGLVGVSINELTISNSYTMGIVSATSPQTTSAPVGFTYAGGMVGVNGGTLTFKPTCTYFVHNPRAVGNNEGTIIGEEYVSAVDYNNESGGSTIPTIIEFDYNTYRANWLINGISGQIIDNYTNYQTPSEILVSALKDDFWFDGLVKTWEASSTLFETLDNPTNMYDFVVKRKDIYSAIILAGLELSTEKTLVDICESEIKKGKELTEVIHDLMQFEFNIDIFKYNINDLNSKEIELLKKTLEKAYDNESIKCVEFLKEMFSDLDAIMKSVKTIDDCIKYVNTNIALYKMSDSLKAVVNEMYRHCPASNNDLKVALLECVNIINSSDAEWVLRTSQGVFKTIGISAGKLLVKDLWKSVKTVLNKSYPILDIILTSYKAGNYISNLVFSTDDTVEQYYKMMSTIYHYSEHNCKSFFLR